MAKNHTLAMVDNQVTGRAEEVSEPLIEWLDVRRGITDSTTRSQLAALERRAAVGTMTAALVHDIASIVQGAQCAMEEIQFLLEDHAQGTPELREAIGNGAELSSRMLNLFHAMSHFLRSRSVAGMPSSVALLVDRARLITDAYVRTRAAVRIGELPDVAVAANEALVLQTLVNLLRNAADASPDGGFIDIEVFDDGDRVRFVVTDDGPGVAKSIARELFEPGVSARDAGEGFGLGLAISAGVIAEHGGTLRYRRAPGRGAEFEMTLPKEWSTA
ncbi:MAG TPA: sensor histidine kinase [Kofleriaceae bacterium]|nr:sensor histidine kinase [Kofleriaceae bacterium]